MTTRVSPSGGGGGGRARSREDQGGRHFLEWGCKGDDLKRAYSDITGWTVYMVDYIIIIVNNEGAALVVFMPVLPPI